MEEERFICFANEMACIEAIEEKPKLYNPAITSLSKAFSRVIWEITPDQELLSMICLWTRKHSSVAPCLSSEFSRHDLTFSSYWEPKIKLTNSMEDVSRVEAKMQEVSPIYTRFYVRTCMFIHDLDCYAGITEAKTPQSFMS